MGGDKTPLLAAGTADLSSMNETSSTTTTAVMSPPLALGADQIAQGIPIVEQQQQPQKETWGEWTRRKFDAMNSSLEQAATSFGMSMARVGESVDESVQRWAGKFDQSQLKKDLGNIATKVDDTAKAVFVAAEHAGSAIDVKPTDETNNNENNNNDVIDGNVHIATTTSGDRQTSSAAEGGEEEETLRFVQEDKDLEAVVVDAVEAAHPHQ